MLLFASLALAGTQVEPDTVVAFLGDQGLTQNSRKVLRIAKDAGAQIVLHAGDLDYVGEPDAWEAMITEELGADFPYLVAVGNHDRDDWDAYEAHQAARLPRTPGVSCEGRIGVAQVCTFRGLEVLISGVGVRGFGTKDEHATFLAEQASASTHAWTVCMWHKNQAIMQTGGKHDETGWGVYEACREGGALIHTGHEHAYSRTHLMTGFSDEPTFEQGPLVIQPGQTVAWVSGLAGVGVREQKREAAHWASVWTKTQGAAPGVLLCTFAPDGRQDVARCVFRDVNGAEPDAFELSLGASGGEEQVEGQDQGQGQDDPEGGR